MISLEDFNMVFGKQFFIRHELSRNQYLFYRPDCFKFCISKEYLQNFKKKVHD